MYIFFFTLNKWVISGKDKFKASVEMVGHRHINAGTTPQSKTFIN